MSKRKIFYHPFLCTDGKRVFRYSDPTLLGADRVKANRHHLYPKDRSDILDINKEKFILRLWEYRHFRGWNQLFQFCFNENGVKKCSELTIDEIITLMAIKHPFITEKVGTKPWQIVFKDKDLNQAFDLLCRMLAWKFNYQWQKNFPKRIILAVKPAA